MLSLSNSWTAPLGLGFIIKLLPPVPAVRRIPLSPTTSNLLLGVFVPIPTNPVVWAIANLTALLWLKSSTPQKDAGMLDVDELEPPTPATQL